MKVCTLFRKLKQLWCRPPWKGSWFQLPSETFWTGLLETVFGICKRDLRNGKEGSRAIHPSSLFSQGQIFLFIPEFFLKWFAAQNSIFFPGKLVINAVLLVYSALVIPFQLSFWVEDDVCNPSPTLYCDVFVDTIFLVNMIEIMIRGFVYTSGCNNCLF